jgi:hypothetical protein
MQLFNNIIAIFAALAQYECKMQLTLCAGIKKAVQE